MTKKKSTKRALLSSSLSLLICISMLIGSTFAWFTDSVTSGSSKIVAGNLKLDLELLDRTSGKWNSIKENQVPIFDYDLWEPGYTDVKILKIENEGTLALKWYAKFVCMEELTALANVIDVYVCPSETTELTYPADRNLSGYTKAGTLNEFVSTIETTTHGNLEAGKAAYLGIALKMQESAGNEYQGLSLPAFDIQVVATQYTYESDSYDNAYDANAQYPVIYTDTIDSTSTFAEIAEIFANGGNIYVAEDVVLSDPGSGNTSLVTDKKVTLYADTGTSMTFNETTLLKGKGTITVKGGSLETNYELCTTDNATLVIDGGEHSFGAFSATSNGSIVVNSGTLNCRGTYAGVMGISFAENGRLIVNGGNLNMYQPFNLNANRCDAAYIEINGGRIELLNGIENLFVVRNIMDKDRTSGVLRGSSVRITGGTFIANYPVDSAGDATSFIRNGDSPADTNKVLVSNVFNGAPDYDCEVIGGTFFGSWQRADNQRYTAGNGGNSDGLFVENSITGFVAENYQITGDSTNGYVVIAK